MRHLLFLSLLLMHGAASGTPGLHVDVNRTGNTYLLSAHFDTSLPQCAAYRYLTDYESATKLPGILSSTAVRQSDHKVIVERTAEERILFMRVHLHSVLEFTEQPDERLSFTQLSGDSRAFHGHWRIEPDAQGSTLHFEGVWEPDTLIPLFIIDHFAKHDLEKRFGEIARLAEEHKEKHAGECL